MTILKTTHTCKYYATLKQDFTMKRKNIYTVYTSGIQFSAFCPLGIINKLMEILNGLSSRCSIFCACKITCRQPSVHAYTRINTIHIRKRYGFDKLLQISQPRSNDDFYIVLNLGLVFLTPRIIYCTCRFALLIIKLV